jgi:DNA-binding response OmpR family regulator
LRRALEENGLQVDSSQNGEEASAWVRSTAYDLILLSLPLVGGQGLTLLRSWRRGGVRASVLALGAAVGLAEPVGCLNAGADDYLEAPFPLIELLARVRALLRRSHCVPDPVLRIHDLEIDTNAHTVRRAGHLIRLTAREYALLHFLAVYRGRVVNRSMISEHLYDEHDKNTSNVVDVYIRRLRTKIDKGANPPLIFTRWGKGYGVVSEVVDV